MINDLGLDPNEWFDDVPHPHDVMPIATNDRFDMYGSSDADYAFTKAQVERRDLPAELLEVPTSVTNPKPEKKSKIEKTPHHIAYDIATSKYNPFSVGGTEQLDGGSETIQK